MLPQHPKNNYFLIIIDPYIRILKAQNKFNTYSNRNDN